MLKKYLKNTPILILLFLAACATKPESDVDTPEYHYKAGMRAIENGDFQQAIKSFQRSVDLDKKFAVGYGGLGLAHAHLGNNKEAKNYEYSRCPSFQEQFHNTYGIKSIFDYNVKFQKNGITSDKHDQNFYNEFVNPRNVTSKLASFNMSYVFVADNDDGLLGRFGV